MLRSNGLCLRGIVNSFAIKSAISCGVMYRSAFVNANSSRLKKRPSAARFKRGLDLKLL
jgi:hypothetical protein